MRNVGLGIPALHPGRKSKRARHVGVEVSLLEASRDLDKICSPRCQRNAVLRDNRSAHVAGPSEERDFETSALSFVNVATSANLSVVWRPSHFRVICTQHLYYCWIRQFA